MCTQASPPTVKRRGLRSGLSTQATVGLLEDVNHGHCVPRPRPSRSGLKAPASESYTEPLSRLTEPHKCASGKVLLLVADLPESAEEAIERTRDQEAGSRRGRAGVGSRQVKLKDRSRRREQTTELQPNHRRSPQRMHG